MSRLITPPIVTRPPCLPARRRRLDANLEDGLRSLARRALGLSAETHVEVTEWVATDSRSVPHVVRIVCGPPERGRTLVLEKPAERITTSDIEAAAAKARERMTVALEL